MTVRWLCGLIIALAIIPTVSQAAEASSEDAQDVLFLHAGGVLTVRVHITREGQGYQAAWGDFLLGLFESLDADGSFDLDFREFQRGPWSDFRLRDAVTGFTSSESLRFLDFDTNPADNRVSFTEIVEALAQCCCQASYSGQRDGQQQSQDRLFGLLDRGNDGQLDTADLTELRTSLRLTDRNDDEIYTADELQGAAASYTFGSSFIVRDIPLESLDDSPVITPPPGTPPSVYATVVLGYFDRSTSEDPAAERPPGATLSHEEFPVAVEFATVDTNSDGEVDEQELAAWLEARRPDIEIVVCLDDKLDANQRVQIVATSDEAVSTGFEVTTAEDGSLQIALPTAQIVVRATGPADWNSLAQAYKNQFNAADGDNNDYLDPNEARRIGLQDEFKPADADGNYQLFFDEWMAFEKRRLEIAAQRTDVQIANRGSTLFEILESSGDQALTIRELDRLRDLAAVWDRNQSGSVAKDEIPQRFQLTIEPGTPRRLSTGTLAIALTGTPISTNTPEGEGPLWFDRMDRNGDGDLSPREFLGAVDTFHALDADGDELLSRTEAKALASE